MRLPSAMLLALASVAATTTLGGCSNRPAGLAGAFVPEGQAMSSRAMRNRPVVYVADNRANAILVYRPDGGSPIGKISVGISSPTGLATDPTTGDLYVANRGNATVSVYPRGSTSPSATYEKGLNDVFDLVVGRDGYIYVAEQGDSDAIIEYLVGGASPVAAILLGGPEADTLDAHNDLFVSLNGPYRSGGRVFKFPTHQTKGRSLGIVDRVAGDVQFDSAGNLLLADLHDRIVGIYARGHTRPTRTIATTGHTPFRFALDGGNAPLLYVADPVSHDVVVYDYTTGKQQPTSFEGLKTASAIALDSGAPF